jgi:ketosteroid isomerase-like protein
MGSVDVVRMYLERFTSGDASGVAELVVDNFSFEGPILQANNRSEFLVGNAEVWPIVRGYDMRRQWVDGADVCSIYDLIIETAVGAGSIPMAEWCVVRDGKLVSSRVLFDTAAMAALLPAG